MALPEPTPGEITRVVFNDEPDPNRLVDPTAFEIQRFTSPVAGVLSMLTIHTVDPDSGTLNDSDAQIIDVTPDDVARLIDLLAPHAPAEYRAALDLHRPREYRVGDPDPTPDGGIGFGTCEVGLGGYTCTWPNNLPHPDQHIAGTGESIVKVWPVDNAAVQA